MDSLTLKLFTDAHILRQVGRPLLIEFFERFSHLLPYKHFLPSARPDNEEYFECLAAVLERTDELPTGLAQALIEVETFAASENAAGVQAAVGNGSADAESSSLFEAIRAWLSSHTSEALPAEASERAGEGRASSPGPFPPVEERERIPQTGAQPDLRSHNAEPPAPSLQDPDHKTFERLARLSPAQYDRARRAEARQLHLRIQTVDAEVAKIRSELAIEAQANAVKLPTIEAWPEPVNGPELFDQVSSRYTAYLVLPPGAADAFALWGGHSHALGAFHLSPRLNLLSPKGGCGKTTALDVLATMVPRPLRTENISAPVLFRVVDQHQPTLLLDEVDTYLPQAEELRGLLNAGHKRGACAYRCEGDGKAVRAFNAFAPAALAGIGSLPATLRDRSILIPLVEAVEGQIATRFDPMHIEIEVELARKLARWAKDNFDALAACKPALPPGAFNRLADNWRPLFAIAQVAGGDWPARALFAFSHLNPRHGPGIPNGNELRTPQSIALLSGVRSSFTEAGATRMFSKQLVASLRALCENGLVLDIGAVEAGPSTLFPVDEVWLARQLQGFGVAPRNVRIGDGQAKGYDLADFTQAFASFLNGSKGR